MGKKWATLKSVGDSSSAKNDASGGQGARSSQGDSWHLGFSRHKLSPRRICLHHCRVLICLLYCPTLLPIPQL